ncbi:MAG: hypothetical protein AAGG09_06305 [Pseudomonadota bacterium]
MEKENVNFQVPKELINPLIEERIKLAVLDSIGDRDNLVSEMVKLVINQKVNKDGISTGRSYDDKYSLIDVVLRDHIKNSVKEVVTEMIKEKQSVIKDEIKRQLASKRGAERFAAGLLDTSKRLIERGYGMRFDVSFTETES